MTSFVRLLEEFDDGQNIFDNIAEGDASSDKSLSIFENGYQAGWDDAISAFQEPKKTDNSIFPDDKHALMLLNKLQEKFFEEIQSLRGNLDEKLSPCFQVAHAISSCFSNEESSKTLTVYIGSKLFSDVKPFLDSLSMDGLEFVESSDLESDGIDVKIGARAFLG